MISLLNRFRFFLSLAAAKLTSLALRIALKRGSYLPGAVALRICPGFLKYAAAPARIVCVTGTNGKTTVCNLIREALMRLGYRVLANTLGSNTSAGIVTALTQNLSVFNKCNCDFGVFEVDERFTPAILPQLAPELFVVTNLFRDSIMRNAHPEFIKTFLDRAVPAGTKLVLNGDDPISCAVSPGSERVYFGIDKMESDVSDCVNQIDDFRVCPDCGAEVVYEYRRYHQIGKCECPNCDYASPGIDYLGAAPDYENMTISVSCGGDSAGFTLPNDSVFNVYNIVTAATTLGALGFSLREASGAMRSLKIAESRFRILERVGVRVVMQMSKDRNALASSRAFEYVAGRPGKKEIILMMNNYTDEKKWSENTCWLYDCDFEFLNKPDTERIITTGPRVLDYRLRMLYAGFPEDKLRYTRKEEDSPGELLLEGADVYILYGTDGIDIAQKVCEAVFTEARKRAAV